MRSESSTIADYFRIIRRYAWMILLVTAVAVVATVYFSVTQRPVYESSADVLIKNEDLAAALSGIPGTFQDPARILETQVRLARTPAVADRVADALGQDVHRQQLLGKSTVVADANADLLQFRVQDTEPERAATLATEYARQFTLYLRDLDRRRIAEARADIERRITQLSPPPRRTSPLYDAYATLLERREQVRTLEVLQGNRAELVRSADAAVQISPRPFRNGAIGVVLGLILGTGLALLAHALDTRIRSVDELADHLALPALGRVPRLSRRARRRKEVHMLTQPQSHHAEAYRILRTNIEFASLDHPTRTILVTSALPGEGKTTTALNLATAYARAGQKVVLVDLDLRRPALGQRLGLNGPGLTDAVLGQASLEAAGRLIPLAEPQTRDGKNGHARELGLLGVVPTGPLPPDPAEVINSRRMVEVLDDLRQRADIVLFDSPPLLMVGDALALSAHVDGVLVVADLAQLRRPAAQQVRRLLERSPVRKLGFVAIGGGDAEAYGYGYGYGYGYTSKEESAPASRSSA